MARIPASSSLTASNFKISGENDATKAGKRSNHDEGIEKCNSEGENKDNAKPPEPPKDYIQARVRRGQATDSHSLAERARREKISERMTLLQDLVPGCNWVTGKAVMLDEIINYVQCLQRQVEFFHSNPLLQRCRGIPNASTTYPPELVRTRLSSQKPERESYNEE